MSPVRTTAAALCLAFLALPAQAATPIRAASEPPIFPQKSVFALSSRDVGTAVTSFTISGGLPPSAVSQIGYAFHYPHIDYEYVITSFRSHQEAVSYDNQGRSGSKLVSHPVIQGEWLYLTAPSVSPTPQDLVSVGLVYRNLSIIVAADVAYTPATETHLDGEATQADLKTASQLYARAQAFAAHGSVSQQRPVTPSSHRALGYGVHVCLDAHFSESENACWAADHIIPMAAVQAHKVHIAYSDPNMPGYAPWIDIKSQADGTMLCSAGLLGTNSTHASTTLDWVCQSGVAGSGPPTYTHGKVYEVDYYLMEPDDSVGAPFPNGGNTTFVIK